MIRQARVFIQTLLLAEAAPLFERDESFTGHFSNPKPTWRWKKSTWEAVEVSLRCVHLVGSMGKE